LTKATTFWRNATAMNEALLIAGLHQHELTESAERLNDQLQREITERKSAETALREAIGDLKTAQGAADRASKAKDGFLAALSHELRTPLTPVLLAASALHEDERLPADAREQLGMMERNITLEARLIDDLLDLTTISHGKLQLRSQLCDAHLLIGFAVEIVRQDARAKGLSIESNLAAKCNWLMADPVRFQQVIWNLLRNAVKFTPQGGRISIATRAAEPTAHGAWFRLEVTDTGIGIEQERLEQIFLPFDQGGLRGDHRFGGVGLGLAIARAVVDLHGGRISASSAGLNRGATFIVDLPGAFESPRVTPDAPRQLTVPASREIAFEGLPRRLLLVEDNRDTLQIVSLLLEHHGYYVVAATTVASALAAAGNNRFDLVISDLGLPDGTGIELMRELRATYGLRGIVLSGYCTEEDVVRSRDAGFLAHLLKPIANAQLLREVASLLDADIG
jgi:signal transduction histidine kinase